MADKKISQLTNITGANLADDDEFAVVDTSANETKAITYAELKNFNGNVGVTGALTLDDTLTIDGAAPAINISETDIPNSHRIFASGGNLFFQAQDTDGTNDGTIVMSGYFAAAAKLIQASTSQFTVTGNSSVNGNSTVLGDLTVDTSTLKVDSTNNRVGIGTASPSQTLDVSGNVRIASAANPYIEIKETGAGGVLLTNVSDNISRLQHTTSAGAATLDIVPIVNDGTSASGIRIFRTTNTTGAVYVDFFRGDNTGTINHRFYTNNNQTSYMCADNGELHIGSVSAITQKFGVTGDSLFTGDVDVTGTIGQTTTTVASLPTGAAGDRSFVTDANSTTFASVVAGGGSNGVPVYHDGTNWRIG